MEAAKLLLSADEQGSSLFYFLSWFFIAASILLQGSIIDIPLASVRVGESGIMVMRLDWMMYDTD